MDIRRAVYDYVLSEWDDQTRSDAYVGKPATYGRGVLGDF